MKVEDLKKTLANYENLLSFEQTGDNIKVQATRFLPKNQWDAINEQIRHLGGRYVSLGKDSHWIIKAETSQPTSTDEKIRDAIDLIEKGLTKLREAGY